MQQPAAEEKTTPRRRRADMYQQQGNAANVTNTETAKPAVEDVSGTTQKMPPIRSTFQRNAEAGETKQVKPVAPVAPAAPVASEPNAPFGQNRSANIPTPGVPRPDASRTSLPPMRQPQNVIRRPVKLDGMGEVKSAAERQEEARQRTNLNMEHAGESSRRNHLQNEFARPQEDVEEEAPRGKKSALAVVIAIVLVIGLLVVGLLLIPDSNTGFLGNLKRTITAPLTGRTQTQAVAPTASSFTASITSSTAPYQITFNLVTSNNVTDVRVVDENGNLIGEAEPVENIVPAQGQPVIDMSIEKLRVFDYLLSNFYTVDSTTMIGPDQLNADDLLGRDMKIDRSTGGPKILIFHTHSQEEFADSIPGDPSTSIVGIGEYLTQLLNAKGVETIHDTGVYDIIDGKLDRSNAYENAEGSIRPILEANPSIEVAIDLHRDGVAEGTHLVTEIDGKQTARIMFFNGLSRTRTNGDIDYLYNPYIQDNLAFSLQMQLASESMYPGFARHIYLRGYRYNLHLLPKSLLIEAGAQTNTVEEMRNAMEVLAETLYYVWTGEK